MPPNRPLAPTTRRVCHPILPLGSTRPLLAAQHTIYDVKLTPLPSTKTQAPCFEFLCSRALICAILRHMRNIRRYGNRKLYDTQESHYVTLTDLAKLIRAGEELRVTSKDTGKDLTAATMAQIIFEETKGGQALPVPALRKIIVSGLPVE
jgi:polyhydroxyalkanoate synthesis repressor PhaR